MSQSEAQLEKELIAQLTTLGYTQAAIRNQADLLANLQTQLEHFNRTTFSDKEFSRILNHLAKGNVFAKVQTLHDRFHLSRDNGESFWVRFFDPKGKDNRFQVTHQITVQGTYKNRYDVTLLVNGLPLVQIELKRRGLELKEAFHQINRYQRHSFWAAYGLFHFVQIFVISNGVNSKYFANNRKGGFGQTFCWADIHNRNINELAPFAEAFLAPDHLNRMLAQYVVLNQTYKILMVLRSYQFHAVEAMIRAVYSNSGNGYIWHTTGSGKTLTSFKASQIIMAMPEVAKVIFVVDRQDLDYQTMKEFNSLKRTAWMARIIPPPWFSS